MAGAGPFIVPLLFYQKPQVIEGHRDIALITEFPRDLQALHEREARCRIGALHSGKTGDCVERLAPKTYLAMYFWTRQHGGKCRPSLTPVAVDLPEGRQCDGQTQPRLRAV